MSGVVAAAPSARDETTGAGAWAARALLLALVALKLAITAFNAGAYDNHQYDYPHHVWRARTAGLEVAKMAYNPPLYYLPTLALLPDDARAARKAPPGPLLELLRYTNVGWLALFYLCWIVVILPRVLPDRRTAFVASLLLLALPGYQKLGMLAHPDNALAALSAFLIATWLCVRERIRAGERNWAALLALALATGLAGLTRPLAIAPVGVFWAVMMLELARGHRPRSRAFLARAAAATLLAATLAGSWYVYRWASSDKITDAYDDRYIANFAPHRAGFPFLPYFTTFHLRELLEVPNRKIGALDDENPWPRNRYANSFFTILYSETWGDHWLYFSGPVNEERKLWEKRVLFLLALPLVPLLFWRFGRGALRALRSATSDPLAPGTVVFGFFAACAVLYLYWQTGPALLPGKNSTIKFIYNAHLYPAALAVAFLAPVRERWFRLWVGYALILGAAALPLAVFRLG